MMVTNKDNTVVRSKAPPLTGCPSFAHSVRPFLLDNAALEMKCYQIQISLVLFLHHLHLWFLDVM